LIQNDPILVVINDEWYPLIVDYGDENDIFININLSYIDALFQKKRREYEKTLKNNFPNSFEEIKKLLEYKYDYRSDWNFFKQEVEKIMNKNKEKDIINRILNKYPQNKNVSSFISFAQIIIKNTKTIVNQIKKYFPSSINIQIKNEISFLEEHYNNNNKYYGNGQDKNIISLIQKLYNIFRKKYKEIKNNDYKISSSNIKKEFIEKKMKEIQKKYYSIGYNQQQIKNDYLKNNQKNEYLKKLELKINEKIKQIQKDKNNNSNNNINDNDINSNNLVIIGNQVKIKEKEIQKKTYNDNQNQNEVIDSSQIEIDEIQVENIKSIYSIMEFFDNCISKTRILPIFIKVSVMNKNEKEISKAINIFNKLFAIYKEAKKKSSFFIL